MTDQYSAPLNVILRAPHMLDSVMTPLDNILSKIGLRHVGNGGDPA